MTTVFLRNGSGQISLNCNASRTWRVAANGEYGEAWIDVPLNQVDSVRPYINWDGGSIMYFPGQGGAPQWLGVTGPAEHQGSQVRIPAMQPWSIIGQRFVALRRNFRAANSGFVWWMAALNALGGLGGYPLMALQSNARTSPIIDYDFEGQDLQTVANDLMALSDGEVVAVTTAHTVYLEWQGSNPRSIWTPLLLVADGSVIYDVSIDPDPLNKLSRVIVKSDRDQEFQYMNGRAAYDGWPAQAILMTERGSQGRISSQAYNEMNLRAIPGTTFTCKVARRYELPNGLVIPMWVIEERWNVRVNLPRMRAGGTTVTARIIEKTISDENGCEWVCQVLHDESVSLLQIPDIGAKAGRRRSHNSVGRTRQPPWREIHDIRRRLNRLELS